MTSEETSQSAVMTVAVRAAVTSDIPAMIGLIQPFVDQGKLLGRTLDELEQLIPSCFVAECEVDHEPAQMVGCAVIEIYSPKLAELRSLCVKDGFQRHGIGHRLVEACLQRAREHHVLEVLAITSAERFFVSCGFDFTLPGEKKALFFQTRDSQ